MDSIDGSSWDVLISGTGLPQSLLALALSRSGQKVLHIDKNDYYGGNDAALSLQEAEEWVKKGSLPFEDARIHVAETTALSYSRAYTLSLSPQLIYTQSKVLSALVSSKIYRQLEFQAVGHWWLFKGQEKEFYRIPNGREDVFSDENIDFKSRRALMKFLKSTTVDEPSAIDTESFSSFLSSEFSLPAYLQDSIYALTLAPCAPAKITSAYASPRIRRHLRSIGMFGPGFGSVIPKWGGAAEICQVACRAGAVGGGTYMLNCGLKDVIEDKDETEMLTAKLSNDETVKTRWIVGSKFDVPSQVLEDGTEKVSRSITIVSSPFSSFLTATAEGAPSPVAAVVVFPTGSLSGESIAEDHPPVYIIIHSGDTGECPVGQSILYSSTLAGKALLQLAVDTLVSEVSRDSDAKILWSLNYIQRFCTAASYTTAPISSKDHVVTFSEPPFDLAASDELIEQVREAWREILPEADDGEFLQFVEREVSDEIESTI